jgi:mutator protein MutT
VRIDVVAAIIRRQDRILITKRLGNVHLAGMWEFPGGKVEAGESLPAALEREIREELGIEIQVAGEFITIEHDYPSKAVCLHFFNCSIVSGEPQRFGVADYQWVEPQHLSDFEFPPADVELIRKLQSSE